MALFDVLRYSIDIDFKEEDLNRIPIEILNDWWIVDLGYGYNLYSGYPSPGSRISERMRIVSTYERKEYLLLMLKKRIQEYDNDNI